MPRHKHDAVGLADGGVLIVGGADEREAPRAFDTAEVYDPETDLFRRTGNLNLARYKLRGTSILQEGGRVVVAGGAGGPEVYEPASGEFTRLSGSFGGTPLFAAASRARGGVLLLCGGYSSEGGPTDAAWLLRPSDLLFTQGRRRLILRSWTSDLRSSRKSTCRSVHSPGPTTARLAFRSRRPDSSPGNCRSSPP